MTKKTEGVYQLVQDVLSSISESYGEDIIEDVCLAIERDADWRQRYQELGADLPLWVVNNWIGQYTKQLTGLKSTRRVEAKRSRIIKSYTKLSR